VDETIGVELPAECHCGGRIEKLGTVEQIQEELPKAQPVVKRFLMDEGRCLGCGAHHRARHPEQTSTSIGAAGVVLGARAQAAVAALHHELGLSAGKTSRALRELTGLELSRGAVVRVTQRVGKNLEPTQNSLIEAIRHSPVVSPDETGWRLDGDKAWLWVFATLSLTVYSIHQGRGFEEAASVLGADFKGVLVRDGWCIYRKFTSATHQSCVAHYVESTVMWRGPRIWSPPHQWASAPRRRGFHIITGFRGMQAAGRRACSDRPWCSAG
jgi:transposase